MITICGIAGFALTRRDKVDGRALSKALLSGIVSRGKDATGIAYYSRDDRQTVLHKEDINAYRFIPKYLPKVPPSTRLAILHTRAATKGSPKRNVNNHPIISGPLVGVHNGWLVNDDEIFADLGPDVIRHGEVDSEAIFAMLGQGKETPIDCLGKVAGRAALAWLDARDPGTLYLARADGSPLAVGQTRNGGVVFASTMTILNAACKEAKVELVFRTEMPEMTYSVIKGGRIHAWESIKVHEQRIADEIMWGYDRRSHITPVYGNSKSSGSAKPKGPTVIGGSTTKVGTGTVTRRPDMTAGKHSTPAKTDDDKKPSTTVVHVPRSGESGKPDPTPAFHYGHQAEHSSEDRWNAEYEAYQAEQASWVE